MWRDVRSELHPRGLEVVTVGLDTLGADGIQLMTSYDDRWPGHPDFDAVFDELNRRKALVFVHPLEPACCAGLIDWVPPVLAEFPQDTTRCVFSLLFSGTLARCPDIRFIFCHAGGAVPVLAGRAAVTGLHRAFADSVPNGIDHELERRGHRFARYADDLLVVVRSRRAGERVKASITRYLTKVLKLSVNESKSRVCRTNEVVFLGFTFRGKKLGWSDDVFDEFLYRVRKLTGRSWGVSMEYRLRRLAWYLRGWMNYFGISEYYRPVPELDAWLRRRIRMCYWKQWRRPRTRVRHLLALGTSRRQAIFTAASRKAYWHLAKTLATQSGMTNQWLANQGLVSIRQLWMKAHGYA